MTKAIFFDIDGTLVSFRTHTISPAVLSALHRLREKGIRLFVASGRHPKLLEEFQALFPFDGYVTLSGQYCTCGDRVVRRVPMERRGVEELVAATRDNAFSCIYFEERDIYLNCCDEHTMALMDQLHLSLPPVADPRRALEGDLYQAIALLPREREELLLGRAPHLKTTRWHPGFLDVIPQAGGKDLGLEAVLSHLGIAREDSMAFGDGENDLSMLTYAGTGVAMGSASEQVKAAADYVTGTVDEDGVLSALIHFGLLEP